jgi:hypothetical protein
LWNSTIGGEPSMWKRPASVVCGCPAVLPLIGCAGSVATPQQAAMARTEAAGSTSYYPTPRIYPSGPAAPAAVLVLLPGNDSLVRDPTLWEAQGFDVIMPPTDIYRLVADQEAAMARLIASAEAMANAPIWLVGPSQVIETAIPQAGGRVSGVIVTSGTSPTYSCSESFSYFDPGTGAPPKMEVKRSGNCGPGLPEVGGRQPSAVPAPVTPRTSHHRGIGRLEEPTSPSARPAVGSID